MKESCIKYIDKCFESGNIIIPCGECHGDLTISNMLFANNQIYLIDFLDSYIESPMQDIVKIRQDTNYYLITLLYNYKDDEYNLLQIKNNLNYIDNIICLHFNNYFWYIKYYGIFQLINLIRIIPYLKDEDCLLLNKINLEINNLLYDLKEVDL